MQSSELSCCRTSRLRYTSTLLPGLVMTNHSVDEQTGTVASAVQVYGVTSSHHLGMPSQKREEFTYEAEVELVSNSGIVRTAKKPGLLVASSRRESVSSRSRLVDTFRSFQSCIESSPGATREGSVRLPGRVCGVVSWGSCISCERRRIERG